MGELKWLINASPTLIIAVLFYITNKAQCETHQSTLSKICDRFDAANRRLADLAEKRVK